MSRVHDIVLEKILQQMEKGEIPWQKGWRDNPPINYITRRPYTGINVLLLSKGGEYLTFQQIQRLGGKIKKGAKAEIVIFFKPYTKIVEEVDQETGEVVEKEKELLVLRYYHVFHLSDTEGIPSKLKKVKHNPLQEVEKIIAEYKDAPKIVHDNPNEAYYNAVKDLINIPDKSLFYDIHEYYSTLFHEIIHSTGHPKRLNRFKENEKSAFAADSYSLEELVAEIGAAILCQHAGIMEKTIKNSTAYIQSWLKHLKNNKMMIFTAAGRAQKAVDYVLGIKEEQYMFPR
ncbi:Antirestriction protein ArdC [Thermoanaerobacter thermohydrosulfuricus]|uniref:Antirestriction protein ArdC n=1 Tax=Thermoanaerobacter thermohydrosulfuricus TaxID=1516 RepID=A0A1G7UPK5_THETY|nr:zincin-like metallopeptidase domain-containing protein [Thermoanaerobacter thermohydrosulfuricus]SDG49443.1 Antirestriction protein ArdC [Thermoanaerobacter thermohydrosulfuricus]